MQRRVVWMGLALLAMSWLPLTAEAVPVNVALGKPASMSSPPFAVGHEASEGVDGDRNGDYYAPSTFHTAYPCCPPQLVGGQSGRERLEPELHDLAD